MNDISTKIKNVSREVRLLKREHYRRKYRYQWRDTLQRELQQLYTHARSRLEAQVLRPRQGVQLLRARQLTEERG